eukprot:COSAG03_NODE_5926_length_1146_cov_60.337154_1_plen_43_part_10
MESRFGEERESYEAKLREMTEREDLVSRPLVLSLSPPPPPPPP